MAGQKRTRAGNVKTSNAPKQVTEATPPCAQPQLPSTTSSEAQSTSKAPASSNNQEAQAQERPDTAKPTQKLPNPKRPNRPHNKHTKLPKLPPNTTISKRPLLHSSLPTPFASSSSPKVLYITASTPFIPALKRIRKLLSEIARRETQSQTALSKRQKTRAGGGGGKLKNGDVEVKITEDVAALKASGSGHGEKVYLKATGRAIPRALELGVQFQGEESGEYVVKVEMGSVRAVDDVEVSGDAGADGEEDIPETRMRNVSSVTVSIGMK